MMRSKNCPKCGADVSDTYEGDDPSVGIVGGWYCDACDLGIGEDDGDFEPHDDDVAIFCGGVPREDLPTISDGKCPRCLGETEMGFGLAGGGYGPYSYCPKCGIVTSKSQEAAG